MIRLAVSGAEQELAEIARRLRGAELIASENAKSCEGVAILAGSNAAAQAELALAAGQHVLLSGATCFSGDELAKLAVAATAAKRQLAIVNPDRFLPSRQLVQQELTAGKLGEPGLVRVHRWENFAGAGSGQPSPLPSEFLCDIDTASWLIGKSPTLVYAVEQVEVPPASGRFIQAHLGFPGGAAALHDYSSGLPSGEGYQLLHVIGSAGAAYLDDHQNMQLAYQGGQPRGMKASERIRGLTAMLQDFVDGIATARGFPLAISSWQKVLTIATAVSKSLASRQAVSLEGC